MAGASVLAAKACLRSGVGLVTVNGPSCNRTILQESVPEAIYYSDPDERCFTTPIIDIDRYTALAIGPGIGTEKITAQAMIKQIQRCERLSMVIDADAINLLSEHKDWISHLPKYAVLTSSQRIGKNGREMQKWFRTTVQSKRIGYPTANIYHFKRSIYYNY